MNTDHMQIFLLVDAYKRLLASQYKGKRSQVKAIVEYDTQCDTVRRTAPQTFEHFCRLFEVSPTWTGAGFFG